MELDFQLCLDEREDTRIIATVVLFPRGKNLTVHGVAVQLFDAEGESLSSKMLLPVSGALVGPVSSRVELRSLRGSIPPGSEVVATAWWPDGQAQARQTTDPGTTLSAHVLGSGRIAQSDDEVLLDVLPEERDVMLRFFPWIRRPKSERIALDAHSSVGDLEQDLGLDNEDAQWLRDLMDDEPEHQD